METSCISLQIAEPQMYSDPGGGPVLIFQIVGIIVAAPVLAFTLLLFLFALFNKNANTVGEMGVIPPLRPLAIPIYNKPFPNRALTWLSDARKWHLTTY